MIDKSVRIPLEVDLEAASAARGHDRVEVTRGIAGPVHSRTHAQIFGCFEGIELLGPGLVDTTPWPNAPDQARAETGTSQFYIGVDRKR